MWDLILSILSSSCIFVVFKLFKRYHVHTLLGIIVNYLTALALGLTFYQGKLQPLAWIKYDWVIFALLLGVFFIVIFNLMAMTSQRFGVSVASVATKMSLIIPVVLGVLLYKEQLGFQKVVGIFLALLAVYYASIRPEKAGNKSQALYLPALVFLGSGIIDSSIKFIQDRYLSTEEYPLFSALVFGAAALSGLLLLAIGNPKSLLEIRGKNLFWGIALGVPNYFSIYFLLRALQWEGLNSAEIFTLNNVAIVLFTTLLGILLFREKLIPKNWLGVGLAIISIVLVGVKLSE